MILGEISGKGPDGSWEHSYISATLTSYLDYSGMHRYFNINKGAIMKVKLIFFLHFIPYSDTSKEKKSFSCFTLPIHAPACVNWYCLGLEWLKSPLPINFFSNTTPPIPQIYLKNSPSVHLSQTSWAVHSFATFFFFHSFCLFLITSFWFTCICIDSVSQICVIQP